LLKFLANSNTFRLTYSTPSSYTPPKAPISARWPSGLEAESTCYKVFRAINTTPQARSAGSSSTSSWLKMVILLR
jgi:hypothetical protein